MFNCVEDRIFPFGCYALSSADGQMQLNAILTNLDGSETFHSSVSGHYINALELGYKAACTVLSRNRKDLVA